MKVKDIVKEVATYKIIKTGPDGTTLQSADMHTMLTLDPEATKGITPNPSDPNQFTLSQAQATGATNQPGAAPTGPKIGAEVEIPANEELDDVEMYDHDDIGGDPTDSYINQVVDKDFEQSVKSEDLAEMLKRAGL